MHVLLVLPARADPIVGVELVSWLHAGGHRVDRVDGDDEALWLAMDSGFDALVIDRGDGDADIPTLCSTLRGAGVWAPILLLTPVSDDQCVAALDAGADDYATAPVTGPELDARLRALVRRGQPERPSVLVVGSVELDPGSRRVRAQGTALPITGVAFDLLELLMRRVGQVITRQQMAEHAWDWAWEAQSNTIEVHIHQLRTIIDPIPGAPRIETVRGVGYRLAAPPSAAATVTP